MKPAEIIKIDLHSHTTASDGEFTPTQLVAQAASLGISHLAITDHDNVEGIDEAIKAGLEYGVEIVPGIELSLDYPGVPGSIHLLGLYIDHKHAEIDRYVVKLKEFREERNLKMLDKVQKLGFDIRAEDFPEIPLNKLGRVHIAKKLVDKGYLKDVKEAFERYLKKGAGAYVNKIRYSVEEGIDFVHKTKGIASLAHPYTLKLNHKQLEIFIRYLKDAAKLDAMEVFYPEHSPRFVEFYLQLVKKYDLIPTGGSDYHGDNKPGLSLGENFYPIVDDVDITYQDIMNRLQQLRSVYEHSVPLAGN